MDRQKKAHIKCFPFMPPAALAELRGNAETKDLSGLALFYPCPSGGIYIQVEVFHLPDADLPDSSGFFGMHIHEFGNCTRPFDQTGGHDNPANQEHPYHAGDLPPLLSKSGYAWTFFYDGRLTLPEILGKSLIIHHDKDDFTTQPSGNSGMKIGCGVIRNL